MSPFDVAWAILKSYTSSPATPDGKIVPSFHEQYLNRRLLESEYPTLVTTDLEASRRLGKPTRHQPSYSLPSGYGSADEREVRVPIQTTERLSDPEYEWWQNMNLADDVYEPAFTVPVAMQQPRPDMNTEKIQYEWVNNPNYIQAYGQEKMLHPSNFSTQKFWQGMESKYPNISQEERVVPDDSYFTANA